MMRVRTARVLQPGEKIRVLVVDDSVVIRRLVCHALEEDPAIEVVGVAANGRIALNRIPQLNPGCDHPRCRDAGDGRAGDASSSCARPIADTCGHVQHHDRARRSATLEALSLGADDYVTKASNAGSLDVSLAKLRQELVPKIRQFFDVARPAQQLEPITVPADRKGCDARRTTRCGDWGFHWRTGRPGYRYPAISGRLPAAGFHRAAHAAVVYATAGGTAGYA